MRALTLTAQAQIAQRLGNEANIYITVTWPNQTPVVYQADRILQISAVNSIAAQDGRASQSVSITLDDIEGDFKSKIDSFDVHNIPCSIYQTVESESFLLFKGCIYTPLTWSEGDRTVTFDVTTRLVDKEAGYTDIYNQDWPLCFGSVRYVPAAKIKSAKTAKLDDILCVPDFSIEYKKSLLKKAFQDQQMIANFYRLIVTGSNALAPPVTTLILIYCDLIRVHRQLMAEVDAIAREIDKQNEIIAKVEAGEGGNGVRIDRANNEIERLEKRREKILGSEKSEEQLKTEAMARLIRGEGPEEQEIPELNFIGIMKLECERLIALAYERYLIKKQANAKVVACHTQMKQIADKYKQFEVEQCEQNKCAKRRVHLIMNEDIPLTGTRFNIGGLLWTGTIDGEYLDLNQPIALYKDVGVTRWSKPAEECESSGWSNFWIDDATKRLSGMYCLVKSYRDGSKHIIKVGEQDGTKCTYDLIAYSSSGSGGNLIQTPIPFTNYNVPFGPSPGVNVLIPGTYSNSPEIRLSAAIMSRLNYVPLSPEEFLALAYLQQIEPQDHSNDVVAIQLPEPTDIYTILGWEVSEILEVAAIPLASWFDGTINVAEIPDKLFWQVPQGETVCQEDSFHEVYVANILPSKIKSIKAYYTHDNLRVLTEVPDVYYSTNENEDVGPFNVTSIRFKTPLNMIGSGQWDDTIYVTLVSSVGLNVVDILEYLISTYTDKTYDPVSFDAVEILQKNYPADFALLSPKNIFTLLSEIAWQARCAIYEIDDVYYLKYLSRCIAEDKTDVVITESDIELSTLELTCSSTEDVITKLVAIWKPDYLDTTKEHYLTLKFNTNIFGENEEKFDFFIYKHEALVQKSATFWLIRLANVWKEISFGTFLTHSELEIYDIVTFTSDHLSTSSVSAEIKEISYDQESKTIRLKLWLPVRFGEMTAYPLAWPAAIDENTLFPTVIDIEKNYVPITQTVLEVQGQ